MTEPVDMKKLGGLSYNANLVSSAKKLKNGKFEIVFKSGEKITYPYQKDFVRSDGSSGIAKTGEDIEVSAVANASIKNEVGKWDVCLVGPQLVFAVDSIHQQLKTCF